MFSLKKLSLALLAASFFSVAQAEEPKQLLVPELYRQNQFINEPEAEFSLQQDESLENVIIHSGYNLQVKRLTAENLPLLQGLIQSQIQPSITGNLDIKNTSQDLFNLRMGNELSYQPKTVSINIWFTGSSKIEIGDNAFLYRSEGMLENSFLRIQPSPNPGEHRLNLTGIVQLSNERVYINLGTNGEWKGGNYAASLPAEPNPKANTYLDLGKNGIFISAAKNNQPIAFSGSGTILFKEGEGADYHPYVKFDNYYKSAGFTTNVRFVISNSAPKGRYEPGDFQGIAIKVQQKVNDKDVLPIINLNKVSTLDYVVNLTDENVNLGNNYFFANIEGDPKSTTDSSSIVIHPATPKAINLNTLDATIGFDTVEGKTYKRAYVTYKKSAAPSKEGSAMQSENVQIGSHTLFSQVEFLPNLIKHGEGFWATADYVQTHYDHVKFKGQQVSVGYSKPVELGGLQHWVGVGFHYNHLKNDEAQSSLKTTQYALSLFDTVKFNNNAFIDVTAFVGQTHGQTALSVDQFAFDNKFKTTNYGASLLSGHRLSLPGRMSITPNLGVIYEHLGHFDFTNEADVRYVGSSTNVTLANVGVKLNWQATDKLSPFAQVQYYHPMDTHMDVEVSKGEDRLANTIEKLKDWTKLTAGVKWQVKPNVETSFTVDTVVGQHRKNTLGLGAALNWRF